MLPMFRKHRCHRQFASTFLHLYQTVCDYLLFHYLSLLIICYFISIKMSNNEGIYDLHKLTKDINMAVEKFLALQKPLIYVSKKYNLNIEFTKQEISIEISETILNHTTEIILKQVKEELKKCQTVIDEQNNEIFDLINKVAKLESDALENEERLQMKIAELKCKDITKISTVGSSISKPPEPSDWIVIQCRKSGKLDFITENYLYNKGFGDPNDEYWIGCMKLHEITKARRHELYIELADRHGRESYARYDNFLVGSSDERYCLLSLGNYTGNAGDALRDHENHSFEFDGNERGVYKSFAWWRAPSRFKCNLNAKLMFWDKKTELKYCRMSIRPIN
ncbi:fibroleukin-like [Drosophila eugracilis]|uniref:fibroleukin-like n=1 Tax=Drosophila eugracilis TaxID=29029 RepID=UPI0007E6E3B6|nr:fibroleukin-like [Drosophila eugracilis]